MISCSLPDLRRGRSCCRFLGQRLTHGAKRVTLSCERGARIEHSEDGHTSRTAVSLISSGSIDAESEQARSSLSSFGSIASPRTESADHPPLCFVADHRSYDFRYDAPGGKHKTFGEAASRRIRECSFKVIVRLRRRHPQEFPTSAVYDVGDKGTQSCIRRIYATVCRHLALG